MSVSTPSRESISAAAACSAARLDAPTPSAGARFGKAMNQLGWHWWPSDSTIATSDYEGRARCINLGHCTPACAQGAKASTDITYWPAARRAGVELRTHCRVREITTDAQTRNLVVME